MEMAVATDALNVRSGIMRTSSSAKVLGFCGWEAGVAAGGGGPVVIWGCWEHEEAGTWWVRVSGGANQVFTPAAAK